MTQVVLEMATTGIIIPKAHFFTFRLFNYLGAYGIFMIVCELTALVCVVYFVGLELKQVRRQGRSHFRSFWNCFQLCTMMTSIICVVMYLLRHAMTTLAMKKITKLEGTSISVMLWQPVILSMFSWSFAQYSFQRPGCIPTYITVVETMGRGERGMNPVAMTIINPRKEYLLSYRIGNFRCNFVTTCLI